MTLTAGTYHLDHWLYWLLSCAVTMEIVIKRSLPIQYPLCRNCYKQLTVKLGTLDGRAYWLRRSRDLYAWCALCIEGKDLNLSLQWFERWWYTSMHNMHAKCERTILYIIRLIGSLILIVSFKLIVIGYRCCYTFTRTIWIKLTVESFGNNICWDTQWFSR